ncbi:hypothetical protein EFS21_01695 [Levilactobacillus brevis]|jgi:hypothetical protein|uniref:hypothetical protein n=1 Tax=Levilactobacillus brevis TaxID=1580 RepID=UPI000B3EAAF8|nr:hypothetical protein [Levilactobacillus brevis]ARW21851.1 hypothetical protein S101174_01008 [Levilactobacillus brevis]ARW50503.1 hypothetical protein S101106_01018 [Levilactobacillus brevis]MCT3589332.1 hypothetical protein [Levilactobacillus brevis]
MTSEIKDNSITVKGSVLNSTEKTVSKGQVIELKVRIPADQFDGKRDAFAQVLEGNSIMTFTPNQTELDTDGEDNPDQTELEVD